MNDHHASRIDDAARAAGAGRTERNPYAITMAALIAGAHVAVADQIQEQPAAPPHDYSIGFNTGAGDGDGDGGGDGDG